VNLKAFSAGSDFSIGVYSLACASRVQSDKSALRLVSTHDFQNRIAVEFGVETVLIREEKIGHECQIELTLGERQSRQLSRHVTLWIGLEI
jgi:hypothetical protein